MGGNFHLKLNIDSRPIANKYREGKVKRTLERELKVREIAKKEANETSSLREDCCCLTGRRVSAPQGSGRTTAYGDITDGKICLSCSNCRTATPL